MSLYQKLQGESEEDVKDAYIKALGLKSYSKNLIDIQTKEIWFEAKDTAKHSTYAMFTQLLHYVQQSLNEGEYIPPFLVVMDTQKAAIMKTADALPLLSDKKQPIKWGKSASGYTQEALDAVSAYIGTHFVSFKIQTHEAEFISTVKNAIKNGDIIRTQITPDNLKQVFDKWVLMIGMEIKGVPKEDYALLFFADIMNDGTVATHDNLPAQLLHKDNAPVFMLGSKIYELGNKEGNRQFWAIYHRPPKSEYRDYLLERRDTLIPIEERSFKGAYYTPLNVVDKAYNKLTETLGNNWGLRKDIAEGKKLLVLINPPYAEAATKDNTVVTGDDNSENKLGVSKTRVAKLMDKQGYAARELFVQFLVRIANEIPTATIAMFSKLKYVNAPNFEKFREDWNSKYLGGFVVDSKSFDGLKGNFPIGFLIWETNQEAKKRYRIIEIITDVLNKNAQPIGEKHFYNLPNAQLLSNWIKRTKANDVDAIPLKNAVSPTTNIKDVRGTKWADGAIASMICPGNDLQHTSLTALLSSGYCSAGGFFVTDKNLWQAAIVFSVRRLIKPTWLNDRDQFLQPTKPLSEEFKNDCLIWMLFSGSNLTASANNLKWNDKTWSIVNHFIPYTEAEVNAPERFESDFMVQYLSDKILSKEAQDVLADGKKLWQAYFARTDVHTVRDELKLNRADVGWYQIRKALQARNSSGDFAPVSFKPFEEAYKALTEKLQPMVYELGFLKS